SGILSHLGRTRAKVHVHVEEISRAMIPSGEAFVAWLDAKWVEMDNAVRRQLDSDANSNRGVVHG
ncbi:MAG: hypothetical protein EBW68_06700, partial [Actinobacteria bacterium]|nr:hypothetical protein [Actinomycetota bacterium]